MLTGDFPCSTGERLIVEVAFAVWNNYTKNIAPIGPMLGTLSGHHIVAIGQLIMALGLSEEDDGEAVAEWIERQPRKWFIDVRPAK